VSQDGLIRKEEAYVSRLGANTDGIAGTAATVFIVYDVLEGGF